MTLPHDYVDRLDPEAHDTACLQPGELARYWPPQGSVSYLDQSGNRTEIDLSATSLRQACILAIDYGRVREEGPDVYVAYQLQPRFSPKDGSGLPPLLAAFHVAEETLLHLGVLPSLWLEAPLLELRDLTGDDRAEIIFISPGGVRRAAAGVSVWTWQRGHYRRVFGGYSEWGLAFVDLDSDGTQEIVISYDRAGRTDVNWPEAYRWDGQSFRLALIPEVFNCCESRGLRFMSQVEGILTRRGIPVGPPEESQIRTVFGHAYEIQGRTAEASAQYEQAWAIYQAMPRRSGFYSGRLGDPEGCRDASQAVSDYYSSIRSDDLAYAYSLLGDTFRRATSFPAFASGFARTVGVRLLEPPSIVGQDGDNYLVAVQIQTSDLTFDGVVGQGFGGTWRVWQREGVCLLDEADIKLVETPP